MDETDENGYKVWKVSAFSHPKIFLKNFESDLFRSDIIVFDWDFAIPINQEDILLNILNNSYSFIYIYSGADKEDQIMEIIEDEKFKRFRDRLEYIDKLNDLGKKSGSPSDLIVKVENLYKENFSFKFGNCLRSTTINALDKVLVRLGELHIEKTLKFLGANNREQIDVDLKDMIGEKIKNNLINDSQLSDLLRDNDVKKDASDQLIELVSEKIKNDVVSSILEYDQTNSDDCSEDNFREIAEELWSYRLYHNPNDNLVRKGDIVAERNGNEKSSLYLVITPDCDLHFFWNKNLGYINLIRLYSLNAKKDHIKGRALLTRKNSSIKNISKISSLSNPVGSIGGSALYFPFLKINGCFKNYIAYPKEITSISIDMPEDLLKIEKVIDRIKPLSYIHWDKYRRITTISEPFLTPVIMHIINSISGYGSPDYPTFLQKKLADELKGKMK